MAVSPPCSTWMLLGSHALAHASLGGSSGIRSQCYSLLLSPAPGVCPLNILDRATLTSLTLSVALHLLPHSPVPSAMSGSSVGPSGCCSLLPGMSAGSFDSLCEFVDSSGWSCDIVPGENFVVKDQFV